LKFNICVGKEARRNLREETETFWFGNFSRFAFCFLREKKQRAFCECGRGGKSFRLNGNLKSYKVVALRVLNGRIENKVDGWRYWAW